MPDMMEIYRNHAAEYDALVNAEDFQGNLSRFLFQEIDWRNALVYEAGIGTGRVTRLYIESVAGVFGFDREQHMLDQCRRNLVDFESRIQLAIAENTALPQCEQRADVFIEGWSFGHTVSENRGRIPETVAEIMANLNSILKPAAPVVIIETLGTNQAIPGVNNDALNEFYALLESQYGFTRNVIPTDYRFSSCAQAAEVMGFFFGGDMGEKILQSGRCVIPEFTGVWVR